MSNFPKVEYVTYESRELPKLGKVKFRPFLVGEHRRLLEAAQLGDAAAVLETLVSIIQACCFDKIDASALEIYVLDALYLEIYIKSRGAVAPASYTCNHVVTKTDENGKTSEGPCGTTVQMNIPLDKAYVYVPEGYKESSVVFINEPTSGIKLRQPNMQHYKQIKLTGGLQDITDEFVFACIECMFDGDRVLTPHKDFTPEAFKEYLDTLPGEVMDKINAFFDDAPSLRLELPIQCPSCGHKETMKLEGLDDFFA